MKRTILLCLIMAYNSLGFAQSYDSAIRYNMIAPTFSVAVDTLIARAVAANPANTGEQLLLIKNY